MPIDRNQGLLTGDVVSVRLVVETDSLDGAETFRVADRRFGPAIITVARAEAELVKTQMDVGDEVREVTALDGAPATAWPFGIIIALSGDRVWVQWPVGDSIEPLSGLRRIRTAAQVEAFALRPGEQAAE